MPLQQDSFFEILFENSINVADFAERIRAGRRDNDDNVKNNGKKS